MALFHSDIIRKAALILAAPIFLSGCPGHDNEAPVRPKNVPKTAAWTRSSEGVVWIACKGGKSGNPCTVYSGSTGDTLIKGTFLVLGTDMGLPADKLSYDYFAGNRILLGDGRILQYIQEQPKIKSGAKGRNRKKRG